MTGTKDSAAAQHAPPMLALTQCRRDSSNMGERRDCAVIALAIACGVSYARAHACLKSAGRCDRCGTHNHTIEQAILKAGRRYSVKYSRLVKYREKPITVCRLLDWELPKRGAFIVRTSSHFFAYVDGKVYCWMKHNSRARVQRAWQIIGD